MCESLYPDFFRNEKRKARKDHKCGECGFSIKVGTYYKYIFGKWDGDVSSFKLCLFCDAVADCLNSMTDGYDCYGAIWEAYSATKDWIGFDEMPFLLIEDKDYTVMGDIFR